MEQCAPHDDLVTWSKINKLKKEDLSTIDHGCEIADVHGRDHVGAVTNDGQASGRFAQPSSLWPNGMVCGDPEF